MTPRRENLFQFPDQIIAPDAMRFDSRTDARKMREYHQFLEARQDFIVPDFEFGPDVVINYPFRFPQTAPVTPGNVRLHDLLRTSFEAPYQLIAALIQRGKETAHTEQDRDTQDDIAFGLVRALDGLRLAAEGKLQWRPVPPKYRPKGDLHRTYSNYGDHQLVLGYTPKIAKIFIEFSERIPRKDREDGPIDTIDAAISFQNKFMDSDEENFHYYNVGLNVDKSYWQVTNGSSMVTKPRSNLLRTTYNKDNIFGLRLFSGESLNFTQVFTEGMLTQLRAPELLTRPRMFTS